MNMDHLNYLETVAAEDISELRRKERTYMGSWKKRGGVGAYMMVARKVDRIEQIVSLHAYDVFTAIESKPNGEDGTALAEVRDLRRYLLLIEAEMMARTVSANAGHLHAISGMSRIKESSRLDDGLKEADIDPEHRQFYMITTSKGRGYHIVNRLLAPPDMWEHLPRLRLELNNKEYEETLPEYHGLFQWIDSENKWRMREQYRTHWMVE